MTTTVRMLLAAAVLMLLAGVVFCHFVPADLRGPAGCGRTGLRSSGDDSSRAQVNRRGAEMTEGK